MAASSTPTEVLMSDEFVICAGCVLLRRFPTLQVCILYHPKEDRYILPKGRKDRGESIQETALRETYEETGHRCSFLPINMKTRSQPAHVFVKDQPTFATGAEEPIAMFLRRVADKDVKLIFWFVAEVNESHPYEKGTQIGSEDYETRFVHADQVLNVLTYACDRDVVAKALELYRDTYPPN
ncbi:NUDIX hydrolase domain-like protein [Rhizoctonia solani]|nr:NUDIX hydrolase domain-like protein [Rhizoctonia solani]